MIWKFLLPFLFISQLQAQTSFLADSTVYGKILSTSGEFLGSAFVATNSSIVITAYHCVEEGEDYLFENMKGDVYPIKKYVGDMVSDIALLLSDSTLSETPLQVTYLSDNLINTRIDYVSFDMNEDRFLHHNSYVEIRGKQFNKGSNRPFIEFNGYAFSGYSGSPILSDGKVVGVLTHSHKKKINSNNSWHVAQGALFEQGLFRRMLNSEKKYFSTRL